jgi:hypothetical protein
MMGEGKKDARQNVSLAEVEQLLGEVENNIGEHPDP